MLFRSTPYPGTKFYDEIKRGMWGEMTEERDKLTNYFSTFKPEGYASLKQVSDMKTYAHKKFYLRPKYILGRLLKIKTMEDIKKYWRGFIAIITS